MHKLWQADPHKYGPGKTHIICDEDKTRSRCGKAIDAIPGSPVIGNGKADCQTCLSAQKAKEDWAVKSAQYAAEEEARRIEREQNEAEFWDRYNAYLRSPEWRAKANAVLARAGHVCEGCGVARASTAHHVTYENCFAEFLWELRAVCTSCHDRFHAARDARRAR